MGEGSQPVGPMVIEIDRSDPATDIAALDIELRKSTPGIDRWTTRLSANSTLGAIRELVDGNFAVA